MPLEDLYIDYGIETAPEEHKHYREGWLNIACPFCSGSEGYHLGFNTDDFYFFCWRCGSHYMDQVLRKILEVNRGRAESISKDYKLDKKGAPNSTSRVIKIGRHSYKYPSGVTAMTKPHRRYLEKRNFDPDYIERKWGVLGTGPFSQLDNGEGKIIPYKYRLLIPIHWRGQEVSFQCRDYTDKQEPKYLACPEVREIEHHKHILYGHPDLWKKRRGICVEGALDVWRLKHYACSTLGVGYTPEQLRLLAELFDELFIMFDPEPIAQKQGEKLCKELRFRGVKAHNYTDLETDPGAMSDKDAKHLLKELKLK